jgi:hypothetical protein
MRRRFVEFVEREVLTSTSEASTANYLEARPDVAADASRDAV